MQCLFRPKSMSGVTGWTSWGDNYRNDDVHYSCSRALVLDHNDWFTVVERHSRSRKTEMLRRHKTTLPSTPLRGPRAR